MAELVCDQCGQTSQRFTNHDHESGEHILCLNCDSKDIVICTYKSVSHDYECQRNASHTCNRCGKYFCGIHVHNFEEFNINLCDACVVKPFKE